jgi:Ca2+-binding RTX toxin-like protein
MTNVSGTYQNETLYGLSSNDSLDGGAGADTLFGLAGNDYLFGGEGQLGNIQILVEDGFWEEGPDVEKEVWVEDWVYEDIYNDEGEFIGTELVDYGYWDMVYEPGENVWVPPQYDYEDEWVFDSSDSLLGGAGNDTLKGSLGGFFVPIDTGIRRAEAPDTLIGGAGDDLYLVYNVNKYDDEATLWPGDTIIEKAGEGTDTIRLYANPTILNEDSYDTENGIYILPNNIENIELYDDALHVIGNSLANRITGNAESNYLDGGKGNDTLAGGAGNDYYEVDTIGDLVIESANGGTDDRIFSQVSYTLPAQVENLVLEEAPVALNGTGNNLSNEIYGNALNNVLTGNAGNDTMLGGLGADLLDGGAGADSMIGGAGNDTYIYDNTLDEIIEVANEGTDTILLGAGITAVSDADIFGAVSLEVVRTTAANSNITLAANAQKSGIASLMGGSGTDVWNASAMKTSITMDAGAGTDSLLGGTGNDSISSGAGNDIINAGRGLDTIKGGEGNDTVKIDWSALTGATITNKVEKIAGTSSYKGTITAKNSGGTILSQVTLDSIESIQLNGKAWSPEPPKPGVAVVRTSTATFTTEQGGKVEYSVVLKAQPYEQPVYVDFQISDATEAKVLTPRLSFTPSNWSIPQTLVVQGVDDYLDDKNVAYTVNGKIVTEALNYNRLTVDAINLINNDDGQDIPMEWLGTNGIDYKDGGNGNDILYAGGSQDQVRGGRGDDEIYGEGDNDRLLGEDGNDEIYGGYGKDTLDGGNGNDSVFGEQGQDTLLGGAGNDYMDGGLLNDSMSGGAGNDTYIVDNAGDIINDLGATSDVDVVQVIQTISYTLPANIENAAITASGNGNLTGNALNNGLTGNADKNILDGGTGNDKLDGGSGADSLWGGVGNDALLGGAGNDTMRGGEGVDLADFAAAGVDITIDLATGRAKGDGTDLLFDIENILAGDGDDTLAGSATANDLDGGAGIDSLNGGAGNDTMAGCFFGANGGRGEIDTLVGGVGNDIFQLGWASGRFYDDGMASNAGRTDYVLITDFTVGQDKLQLDGTASNYYLAASGVAGVTGIGLYAEQGATDELIAIIRSANSTALNASNTVNMALLV